MADRQHMLVHLNAEHHADYQISGDSTGNGQSQFAQGDALEPQASLSSEILTRSNVFTYSTRRLETAPVPVQELILVPIPPLRTVSVPPVHQESKSEGRVYLGTGEIDHPQVGKGHLRSNMWHTQLRLSPVFSRLQDFCISDWVETNESASTAPKFPNFMEKSREALGLQGRYPRRSRGGSFTGGHTRYRLAGLRCTAARVALVMKLFVRPLARRQYRPRSHDTGSGDLDWPGYIVPGMDRSGQGGRRGTVAEGGRSIDPGHHIPDARQAMYEPYMTCNAEDSSAISRRLTFRSTHYISRPPQSWILSFPGRY